MTGGDRRSVDEFGATGNGSDVDTDALQAALDDCGDAGGTVVVPPGTYPTGPLTVGDRTTLEVRAGATIQFLRDEAAYPDHEGRWEGWMQTGVHPCLLVEDATDITITGRGTLDGQGDYWWQILEDGDHDDGDDGDPDIPSELQERFSSLQDANDRHDDVSGYTLRPPLVRISRSENVTIDGLRLCNSPFWNTHVVFSENVTVHDVTVENPADAPNSDGIDVDSSRAVRISDSHVDVGDDAICLKSGKGAEGRRIGRPTAEVAITNCTVRSGHGGVVIGSETAGDVHDVTVNNCTFTGTDRGIRIKTRRSRGGVVENCQFRAIVMRGVACPITVNGRYMGTVADDDRPDGDDIPVDDGTPTVRDLYFDGITAVAAESAGTILGLPERRFDDVRLTDVDIAVTRSSDADSIAPAMVDGLDRRPGLYCRDVADLSLRNVRIATPSEPAVVAEASRCLSIDALRRSTAHDTPAVQAHDVDAVLVSGCDAGENPLLCVDDVDRLSLAGNHGEVAVVRRNEQERHSSTR